MGRLLTPAQVRMIGAQAQASLAMLPDHLLRRQQEIAETDTSTQVFKAFHGYLRQAAHELSASTFHAGSPSVVTAP